MLSVLGTLSEDHREEWLWELGETDHCLRKANGYAGQEKTLILGSFKVQSQGKVEFKRQICTQQRKQLNQSCPRVEG